MISSLAGVNPIAGMAAYCASKAGLDHFAACLMLEVRQQGVKVTTLAPGSVDTDFGGDSRSGDASWMLRSDDVAAAVLDLLRTPRRRAPEPRRDASAAALQTHVIRPGRPHGLARVHALPGPQRARTAPPPSPTTR